MIGLSNVCWECGKGREFVCVFKYVYIKLPYHELLFRTHYVHMYVNGKMVSVETIPGMGEKVYEVE
jgi:hypothetical protein